LRIVALGENGEKPEYIVWDGKLDDNFTHIDKVLRLIGVTSSTAPQLFGIENWGSDMSGRALKVLFIQTLARVATMRRYYTKAIQQVLSLAQALEGETDPVRVGIEWPDGLPSDVMEQVEEVDRRITNRTLDRKSGIKRLDGATEDEADAVITAIDEDDANEETVVTNARPRVPINVNLGNLE